MSGQRNYKKVFDEDRLKMDIPMDSLLVDIGAEFSRGNKIPCTEYHKKKKQPDMHYLADENIYYCNDCATALNTISAVMKIAGKNYYEACTYLHEAYSIPYLEGDLTGEVRTLPKNKSIQAKKIEYLLFDAEAKYSEVSIRDHIKQYHSLNVAQRLKMVYTFFYRFSMNTGQKGKFEYYKKERGIPKNNTYIQEIGYLSQDDSRDVLALMKKYFGEADLLEFGILKDREGKIGYAYESIKDGGLLVVPSFDLYTDMVTGFMIRPTHPPKWMKENGTKELQLSKTHIVKPLPFGLTFSALKTNHTFYVTEGHPDLASIPGNINGALERAGIASPGTYGFKEEHMSLLRGKRVVLIYDQDFAGQRAEHGYHELFYQASGEDKKLEFLDTKEGKKKLKEELNRLNKHSIQYRKKFHKGVRQKLTLAGVKEIETLKWNRAWGGDINDLRINGNLSLVFTKEKI